MKTLLISLVAAWLPILLHAQIKTLTGSVRNKTGKAVPLATVMLKNRQGLILQYAICNDQGLFRLNLIDTVPATDLSLEVSHLSFKIMRTPLIAGKYAYELILEESFTALQEVNVKSRPMAITKGDTTSFNVRSFSHVEDRSIADVLGRIPGVTVDEQGKIYYNGKAVSNLYIQGDDLMD